MSSGSFARPARRLRFDRVERVAHWTIAALFGTLVATGIPLYFGSLFGVVLDRHTIQLIHLWVGLALPIPLIVAATGPWGRRMRRDVRRFVYWRPDEIRWILTAGRTPVTFEKFNAGQKLNAVTTAGLNTVLLISGAMLQWFRFFPVSTRVAATFVHDSFALAVSTVMVGHILMALAHPPALKSMITGSVSTTWATRHAPNWVEDEPAGDKVTVPTKHRM